MKTPEKKESPQILEAVWYRDEAPTTGYDSFFSQEHPNLLIPVPLKSVPKSSGLYMNFLLDLMSGILNTEAPHQRMIRPGSDGELGRGAKAAAL